MQTHSPSHVPKCAVTLLSNLNSIIHGHPKEISLLVCAFASGIHVLIEDVPGTGKTTLAKALAQSVKAQFNRIQFTADLLPSDLLGGSILEPENRRFHFQPGPIFTEILLADEINRASPRTQSALLEAMAEQQVTIEGHNYLLPPLFFTIATQNPVDFHGTFPLPEAQLDRFGISLRLGYVSPAEELEILNSHRSSRTLSTLQPCATVDEILQLRTTVESVEATDEIKRYVIELCAGTRRSPKVQLGASPRASLNLLKMAQAHALIHHRAFVIPEDIQQTAVAVIAHRLVLTPEARFAGDAPKSIVQEILERTPIPL